MQWYTTITVNLDTALHYFEMGSDSHANLTFTEEMLRCSPVRGPDVEATLEHFAIVSYAVPSDRVRQYVDPQFNLDCFPGAHGERFAWVSMVPFKDQDFRFAAVPPWLRFRFG